MSVGVSNCSIPTILYYSNRFCYRLSSDLDVEFSAWQLAESLSVETSSLASSLDDVTRELADDLSSMNNTLGNPILGSYDPCIALSGR